MLYMLIMLAIALLLGFMALVGIMFLIYLLEQDRSDVPSKDEWKMD